MSTAGGMAKAIERGESIGCTAIQVFVKGNPRWQFPPLKDDDVAAFRAGLERGNIKSVIAHAIYLVNLCSNKPEFVRKSVDDLVDELTRCHTLGGGSAGDASGIEVGPPLRGIGSELSREQLLEALVDPSARIAPGFGVQGAPSAMPPMGSILTRREIRDVVEFLSGI